MPTRTQSATPSANSAAAHTTAPSAAVTLGLTSGQSLWLCLPPGSVLHTTQGEVSLRFAPQDCGHALHTPPQARLGAGDHRHSGSSTQTTWVQVDNALPGRAEIQVIEQAPAPGLWHQARHLLRTAFAGRDKTAQDRTFGNVPALR
ncbi:hypothetical protein [Acidovorax sp. LjRoot194]|uniref:hypothetical protein n=1 Tax=Acidovorax sp. LjRoot194 TaxID=3342280 RepID=UPI003ECE4239